MILAGAVTLLKLLDSFYASHLDIPHGRTLFSRSVSALRRLSVRSNDLPQRLAEVLAQLWENSHGQDRKLFQDGNGRAMQPDNSLQLHVRCRSSLSVLFDAIWRWREQVGNNGRVNLERAVEHPTAVASGTETQRNTPQPPGFLANSSAPSAVLGLDDPALEMSWDHPVFDTLGWALDGGYGLEGGLNFGPG
jgi:hypothetical protein